MRLAPFALAVLLLPIAMPLAGAGHATPAAFARQVEDAGAIQVVMFHEHAVHGAYEGSKTDPCAMQESAGRWQLQVLDVGTGSLTRDDEGRFVGDVYVTRDLVGSSEDASTRTDTCTGGPPVARTVRSACEYDAHVHGEHDRMSTSTTATLSADGRALVFQGPSFESFLFRGDEATCRREESYEEPLVSSSRPRLKLTALVEGRTHERAFFHVAIPLDGPRTSHEATFVFPIPSNEGLGNEYCFGHVTTAAGSGRCTVTSALRVRLVPDSCGAIARDYQEHLARLRDMPRIEAGAPEPYLRVWHEEATKRIHDVLMSTRDFQLIGCAGELPEDPFATLVEKTLELRRALVELLQKGALSDDGKRMLLGLERQAQLLGVEDGLVSLSDLQAAPPEGTMTIRVRSPVSLHVYAEDGAHVGWDDAAGAPEIGIVGATYEGEPRGQQTITLPTGAYKVEVEELDEGTFVLDVTANVSGAVRSDSVMLASRPGRTMATHYAVDDVDANGTPVLQMGFPLLRPSGGEFRWREPATMALYGVAREPAAGDGDEATARPTPTPAVDAEPRGSPGLALVGLLAAVALVARMRRR